MSTSATISFRAADGEETARIFRQCDGMPEHLGQDLLAFFEEVERQCPNDTRFNDPGYLAAKWVVFDAARHGGGNALRPLAFLSVGVVNDSWEGQYHYDVRCHGNVRTDGRYFFPDVDCARVPN